MLHNPRLQSVRVKLKASSGLNGRRDGQDVFNAPEEAKAERDKPGLEESSAITRRNGNYSSC